MLLEKPVFCWRLTSEELLVGSCLHPGYKLFAVEGKR
jgi:hypothetical protein